MDGERPRPALDGERMVAAYDYTVDIAPSVVLLYNAGLVPRKASPRRHRRSHHPFRQVVSLFDDVDITVASGPGPPVAAITVELLAALGVQRIIAVGSAGRLSATNRPPVAVAVERAESDEGTSSHYGGNLNADRLLTERLVTELGRPAVVALTTDVPFRHTAERLASHRQRADVVEMECAALFAAAHHVGIAAAAVVVPSDSFDDDTWSPLPSDPSTLTDAVDLAGRILHSG